VKRNIFDVFSFILLACIACAACSDSISTNGSGSRLKRNKESEKIVRCNRYQFRLPKGWRHSKSGEDVGLTADNIPAWMVIYPHEHENLADLELDIQQEPLRGELKLMLKGEPKRVSKNAVAIDFSGSMSGVPAKARLIGTISPSSGGVFIFAITSSDESFTEVSNTAENIAKNIQCEESD
jgi:hypothetical protein